MATLKHQGQELVAVEHASYLIDGKNRQYSLRSNGRVLVKDVPVGRWRVLSGFGRSSVVRAKAFFSLLLLRGATLVRPAAWPADLWLELTDHEGLAQALVAEGQREKNQELDGERCYRMADNLRHIAKQAEEVRR